MKRNEKINNTYYVQQQSKIILYIITISKWFCFRYSFPFIIESFSILGNSIGISSAHTHPASSVIRVVPTSIHPILVERWGRRERSIRVVLGRTKSQFSSLVPRTIAAGFSPSIACLSKKRGRRWRTRRIRSRLASILLVFVFLFLLDELVRPQ